MNETQFNKIVLCANPSHQTVLEKKFWASLNKLLKRKGWDVLSIAARSGDFDIVLPARLHQIQNFLTSFNTSKFDLLPPWIDNKHFNTLIEWEFKRWEQVHDKTKIAGGLIKLCWFINEIFKNIKPAVVMTTNKIDHGCSLYKLAGDYYGSKYYFIERSPFDSIWIESNGMFAESDIYDFINENESYLNTSSELEIVGSNVVERLICNPDGFRQQKIEMFDLPLVEGPIIFFPIDNSLWTGLAQENHIQRKIDYYEEFSNVDDVIKYLHEYSKKVRGLLVLKKHPADLENYFGERSKDPSIFWVSGSIESVLRKIDIVVCLNTKIGYTSAAHRIPTVVLSPNTASVLPGVRSINSKDELYPALSEAILERKICENDFKKLKKIFGLLDRHFFYSHGDILDNTKRSIYDFVERIRKETINKPITSIFPESREFMNQLLNIFNKNLTVNLKGPKVKEEVVLFFDITRLLDENLYFSGINRFIRNLIMILREDKSIEIIPVVVNENQLKLLYKSNSNNDVLGPLKKKALTVKAVNKIVLETSKTHLYYSPYPKFPKFLNTASGLSKVITIHDILHLTNSELYSNNKVIENTKSILDSINYNDFIICDSEYTKMQVLRKVDVNTKNVYAVHLAPDIQFKKQDDTKKSKKLLSKFGINNNNFIVVLAQDDPRKNMKASMASISSVLKDNSDLNAVIIASSVRRKNIESHFEYMKDNDQVIFVSNISDQDLSVLYSNAMAFVYASMSEGFGLPIIEAMSCGCPVITSSFTSIPEVAQDGAIYIDPFSVKSITNGISTVINSKSLRSELSKRALKIANSYDWNNVSENYSKIFKIIGKSPIHKVIIQTDKQKNASDIVFRLFPYFSKRIDTANWVAINSIVNLSSVDYQNNYKINSLDIYEKRGKCSKGIKIKIERSLSENCVYSINTIIKQEARNKLYISFVVDNYINSKLHKNNKITLYFDLTKCDFEGMHIGDLLINSDIRNIAIEKIYDGLFNIKCDITLSDLSKLNGIEIGPKVSSKQTIIYDGEGVLSLKVINCTVLNLNRLKK
ncbi:glycosyltransferase [Saprospiraceae bacterium]|nr:glycosyltransferase [Saprospiraceae bacterium]